MFLAGEDWRVVCNFQSSGPSNGQDEPGNGGGSSVGELRGALVGS